MDLRMRMLPALAAGLLLGGCGSTRVVLDPRYDDELLQGHALRRADVDIVEVTDDRDVPPDVVGTAKTGVLNKEVPLLMQPGVGVFVDSVLTLLMADPVPAARYTPVAVRVDSLVAFERTGFFGESAIVRCRLEFAYPRAEHSIARFSAGSEQRASSTMDVTSAFQGLLYEAVAECAATFARSVLEDGRERLLVERGSTSAEPFRTGAFAAVTPGSQAATSTSAPAPAEQASSGQDSGGSVPGGEDLAANPLVVGLGFGLGSSYATLGGKLFAGGEHLQAEFAVGTEPFVWKRTLAAGGSVTFFDQSSRVRPRLSVLWKSNASEVEAWDVDDEKKRIDVKDYYALPGIVVQAGLVMGKPDGWVELSVGWRTPFEGMDAVEAKAEEFFRQWTIPYGYEVVTPRWDHFAFSLGVNIRLNTL